MFIETRKLLQAKKESLVDRKYSEDELDKLHMLCSKFLRQRDFLRSIFRDVELYFLDPILEQQKNFCNNKDNLESLRRSRVNFLEVVQKTDILLHNIEEFFEKKVENDITKSSEASHVEECIYV